MNNILVISQDGKFTSFVRSMGIGRRQESYLIGDKLNKLLKDKNMTSDDLVKEIGHSYRDNIMRVLDNQETPKKQLVDKLVKLFEVEDDYFKEKELENVIITDSGIVVAKYDTNVRTIEVKNSLDKTITELFRTGKPIIIEMPKK